MIKHIAGFIIFTFVIGTSALIAALLNPVQQTVRSVKVSRGYDHYSSRKRCKKKRKRKRRKARFTRLRSMALTQAVYDSKNDIFETSLDVRGISPRRSGSIYFHFYVKDESGIEHLGSERVATRLRARNVVKTIDWLKYVESFDNVYVMAEFRNRRSSGQVPVFDASKAVPVLTKHND